MTDPTKRPGALAVPRWKQSRSRVYANVNTPANADTWTYENMTLEFRRPDDYEIVRKIGRGKYSEVFEGVDMTRGELVVIKVLKPVKKKKILREVKVLNNLRGGPNIVGLFQVVRDPETKMPSFIFEHVNNVDFKVLYPRLRDHEVRFYMYQVLKALDYSHSKGIMHRDIKPHNVMIDHEHHRLRVIDWGLAEFYHQSVEYNVRVASRHYKGPELLVDLRTYDYSLDMWSFGCMMAGIIFKKTPFFRGRDNNDQLVKIAQVLGSDECFEYIRKYDVDTPIHDMPKFPRRPWESFVNEQNANLATPDAIDLIDRTLRFDHQQRLTAREAMLHQYFADVRTHDSDTLSSGLQHPDYLDIMAGQVAPAPALPLGPAEGAAPGDGSDSAPSPVPVPAAAPVGTPPTGPMSVSPGGQGSHARAV